MREIIQNRDISDCIVTTTLVFHQNVCISALRASLPAGKMLQPAFVLRAAKTKTIAMTRSLTKTKTKIKAKAKAMAKCMALH